jgi:putative cell wall-binding protein
MEQNPVTILPDQMRFSTKAFLASLLSFVMILSGLSFLPSQESARALSGSQFNPGYIISDEIFFNGASMSGDQVQSFLDAQVPTCTINNGDPARRAGAPWGTTTIASTCLKNYRQQTPTMAAQPGFCSSYPGSSSERAADIIAKVGQACNISQKVLLVLLQKEQSLVTDTWPTVRQFEAATGYACYDNGQPCVQQYAGFFYQVWSAARQFQRYGTGSLTWIPVGQTVNRPFHPEPACGSRPVLIQNRATAALYYYTPYTPNQAALNNLYGTGDSCSSYGNRNFWRMFTDWFGSTTSIMPAGTISQRLSGPDRYSTAVAISQNSFPNGGAPVVYITTGDNYPDALSAAPAAARGGGVVLLTDRVSLPWQTNSEVSRLNPSRIVVVGGEGAISAGVYNELAAKGIPITRISGYDRYSTSLELARHAFQGTNPRVVYLATGEDFPDALSASAAAGANGGPVILVRGNQGSLDQETKNLIQQLGASVVNIAGGNAAISSGIEASAWTIPGISNVNRLGGSQRYMTSEIINNYAFSSAQVAYVSTGENFPDGLTAAASAGINLAPLYLSNGRCLAPSVMQKMIALGVTKVLIIGGTGVLSSSVSEFKACS